MSFLCSFQILYLSVYRVDIKSKYLLNTFYVPGSMLNTSPALPFNQHNPKTLWGMSLDFTSEGTVAQKVSAT